MDRTNLGALDRIRGRFHDSDDTLTQHNQCQKADSLNEMRMLEAQNSPDTRDDDDEDCFSSNHAVPDTHIWRTSSTRNCGFAAGLKEGREKTEAAEDVDDHGQTERKQDLVEFSDIPEDGRMLYSKKEAGSEQDEGETSESTALSVGQDGKIERGEADEGHHDTKGEEFGDSGEDRVNVEANIVHADVEPGAPQYREEADIIGKSCACQRWDVVLRVKIYSHCQSV